MAYPINHNHPRAFYKEVSGQLKDGRNYSLRCTSTPEEFDELVGIYQKVYRELDEEWSADNTRLLLKDLFRNNSIHWVAFVEGQVVGAICCGTKYDFHGKALVGKEFFVLRDEQHAGIGTRLLNVAIQQAQISHPEIKGFELVTFDHTGHARDFYEKLGFIPDERLVIMGHNDMPTLTRNLIERGGESTLR